MASRQHFPGQYLLHRPPLVDIAHHLGQASLRRIVAHRECGLVGPFLGVRLPGAAVSRLAAVTNRSELLQIQAGRALRRDHQALHLSARLFQRTVPLESCTALEPRPHGPHMLDAQLPHPLVVLARDLVPVRPLDFFPNRLEAAHHVFAATLPFFLFDLFHGPQLVRTQARTEGLQQATRLPALGLSDVLQSLGQPLVPLLKSFGIGWWRPGFGALSDFPDLFAHLFAVPLPLDRQILTYLERLRERALTSRVLTFQNLFPGLLADPREFELFAPFSNTRPCVLLSTASRSLSYPSTATPTPEL